MWMIRAGSDGERVNDFLQHGVVAFGGASLGALVATITKEQLRAMYAERYPAQKEGSRAS